MTVPTPILTLSPPSTTTTIDNIGDPLRELSLGMKNFKTMMKSELLSRRQTIMSSPMQYQFFLRMPMIRWHSLYSFTLSTAQNVHTKIKQFRLLVNYLKQIGMFGESKTRESVCSRNNHSED